MKYGYARVSTNKQSLNRQIDSLKEHGVEKIFTDKYTGTKSSRPGYDELKRVVEKDDELFIHALDRLGRSKEIIKNEIELFRRKGVIIRILNMPTTLIELDGQEWIVEMINNIILEVLSSLAQQEHDMLVERTIEGLEATQGTKIIYRWSIAQECLSCQDGGILHDKSIVSALHSRGLCIYKAEAFAE